MDRKSPDQLCSEELQQVCSHYMQAPLTKNTIERMENELNTVTTRWRMAGANESPRLRVLALPGRGRILIGRADAEHEQIQRYIKELGKTPNVTPLEIAHAVRRCYPDYRGTETIGDKA